MNIDKDNSIKSCYGVYSQAAQCEKYWKSWDESETDLDQKCNPDRQCILYSASTCAPPSVKIAIAGVQVSSGSGSSSTGGGGSSSGGGGGAMSAFASAGRASDRGQSNQYKAKMAAKAFKESLNQMKAQLSQMESTMQQLTATLATEQASLASAQAAYNSCMAPCAAPCSCDADDDACSCPTCSCSGQAQAVADATERVSQVQTELNQVTENYNYANDIVEQAETIDDMNGYVLTLIEHASKLGTKHLNLFNGPILNTIASAAKGEISMEEFGKMMEGSRQGWQDSKHKPTKEQANEIFNDDKLTYKEKKAAYNQIIKDNYDSKLKDAYTAITEEAKRISDKHFGGADMNELVKIEKPSHTSGTIFDQSPTYKTSLERTAEKVAREYDDEVSVSIDWNALGKSSFSSEKKIGPDYDHSKFLKFDSENNQLVGASRVVNKIGAIEGNIRSSSAPTIKEYNKDGPVTLNPSWRDTMSSFKGTANSFIKQGQLMYHNVGRFNQGSHAPINEFISFPASGGGSSSGGGGGSAPTSSIQTDMEYMCLWCNEHRKKRLVKDTEQDPVLNEMQVAQPIVR